MIMDYQVIFFEAKIAHTFIEKLAALYGVNQVEPKIERCNQIIDRARTSVIDDLSLFYAATDSNEVVQSDQHVPIKDMDLMISLTRDIDRIKKIHGSVNEWTPLLRWVKIILAFEQKWIMINDQLNDHGIYIKTNSTELVFNAKKRRQSFMVLKSVILKHRSENDSLYHEPTLI